MRTTININDQLLRAAKLPVAESHRTLTEVIEDALRVTFGSKPVLAHESRLRIPTSGSGGLMPGVDLDNNAALLDLMEERR